MTHPTPESKPAVAHTPEPWEAIKLDGYPYSRLFAPNHEGHCRFVYDADGVGAHADMARIVQCVNAMAGVADPALFMAMFKDFAKTEIHSGKNFGGCGELYTTAMKLLNERLSQ